VPSARCVGILLCEAVRVTDNCDTSIWAHRYISSVTGQRNIVRFPPFFFLAGNPPVSACAKGDLSSTDFSSAFYDCAGEILTLSQRRNTLIFSTHALITPQRLCCFAANSRFSGSALTCVNRGSEARRRPQRAMARSSPLAPFYPPMGRICFDGLRFASYAYFPLAPPLNIPITACRCPYLF